MDRQSVLFIVNPISGGKRCKRRIIRELDEKGCRTAFTSYAGEAVILARDTDAEAVVAVGGDGTVNEVARGLVGSGKILGIIPCGSGDGLARHLHLKKSVDAVFKAIEQGRTEPLDWGTIDGKPFFSVCGAGLDAVVSERFAKSGRRGLKTYIREALAVWKGFVPDRYHIEIDGKTIEIEAVLVTVGNSCQWGNGARITPLASTNDGLLDITILKMFRSIEIPALVWHLMTGSMHRSRRALCLKGKDITIRRGQAGPIHFDGDFCPGREEIEIKLMPERIRIIVSDGKAV